MKRSIGLGLGCGVAAAALAMAVHGLTTTPNASGPPVAGDTAVGDIYQIANHLYVVPGGGGNTAVFVMSSGVLLVDTKYQHRYDALLEQVRRVTDKPITYAINTHSHGDHMGGNRSLPAGSTVVAQTQTAHRLADGATRMTSDRGHGSIRSYEERLSLFEGEDAVDLYYFGPAHTDGDTFVVFRAAGVMHAGDVFPDKAPPIINIANGGNGVRYAEILHKATAISGIDRVITGHGPVLAWTDFVEFEQFYRLMLDHVQRSIGSSMDKNAAFKSFSVPDRFREYRLDRAFETMDEIDRSLRPRWLRALPAFLSRYYVQTVSFRASGPMPAD